MAEPATLELTPRRFFHSLAADEPLDISCLTSTAAAFAKFLAGNIGGPADREAWTTSDWAQHIGSWQVAFFAVYAGGEPVGAFEIQRVEDDPDLARIPTFGLLPAYRDEGIAATMLTLAVERAFSMGVKRIELDHDGQIPTFTFRNQGFASQG